MAHEGCPDLQAQKATAPRCDSSGGTPPPAGDVHIWSEGKAEESGCKTIVAPQQDMTERSIQGQGQPPRSQGEVNRGET